MMQNLLNTKLFIPQIPSGTLPRSNLVDRLNAGLAGKLSTVIAPAGYGKTTLVTTWLQQLQDTQVLWLSLDEGDNDPQRFFSYFVGALSQLDSAFEAIAAPFLGDAHGELSVTAIVTSLLNQVAAYGQPVVLVLDDYHEIDQPLVHDALSLWLDNQPPNFHLVITSRTEPPLPLPRMRVRREVVEVDTTDLRFSLAESTDFLNQHMQLSLSEENIRQLDAVTEGWAASLQLAALSLQSRGDPAELIQTFQGDNRYVVDYLVHEVLDKQPDHIRNFLLQTSILGRFNVQLCDAVTGQTDSQQIVEQLDQMRLFTIPLDNRRHWYRYHHLFADCLQTELHRAEQENIATYHQRASHWFNENGHLDEAIHHAFAASDYKHAAHLIWAHMRFMLARRGEPHQLQQWVQRMPDELIRSSPQLLITEAWLKLEFGSDNDERIEELLNNASNLLRSSDSSYTPMELAMIETEMAMAYSTLERRRGSLSQAIEYMMHAVELATEADLPMLKLGTRGGLTICHYEAGNIPQFLELSKPQLETLQPRNSLHYAGYLYLSYQIDGLRLHGKLEEALRLFHRFSPSLPNQHNAGSATFIVSGAEVLRERNQLAEAVELLLPAIDTLKQYSATPIAVHNGTITLARILQAQGNSQEALERLRELQQEFPAGDTYAPSARTAAVEAHLHLRQGNLAAAKAWQKKRGLHIEDAPTYLLEIDYLVFARILIADGEVAGAQTLLQKLEQVTTNGGRNARLIEVYILQALAHQALGEPEQAVAQLKRAIDLTHLQGFVRVFVDEGVTLVPLFKKIAREGIAISTIQQLLPFFDESRPTESSTAPTDSLTASQPAIISSTDHSPAPPLDLLLEPLTDREVDTLRYLTSDLTVPQIAEQMIVAPSTVRSYIKSIYSKLDAHSRMEAVNRARSLGLIK